MYVLFSNRVLKMWVLINDLTCKSLGLNEMMLVVVLLLDKP